METTDEMKYRRIYNIRRKIFLYTLSFGFVALLGECLWFVVVIWNDAQNLHPSMLEKILAILVNLSLPFFAFRMYQQNKDKLDWFF